MRRIEITYRRIGRITAPVMATQLSYTAMGILDTVMVGQLGVVALAGVGLGNMIVWWVLSVFWGMIAGVNTLVAQAEGAEDRPAAGVALWQGIYMGLIFAALSLLLWPLVPSLFALAGVSPEVQETASEYVRLRLFGGIGLMLLMACDNFYRGIGRTDIPMWCGFLKLVVNCGFNYLFIFGKLGFPEMGSSGAAVGTVIANLSIGLLMLVILLVRADFREPYELTRRWRLHRRVLGALFRVSYPIGIQTFMEMGGISVFTAIVGRLGDAQLAATNAVIQAWSVAFTLGFALSVGATTLVGQCVGAGWPADGRLAVRRVLDIGYLLMATLAFFYVVFPEHILALFVEAGETAALLPFARPLFTIVVICLYLDLKFMVLWGALRGAGDTTFPMVANVASSWLLFVPATVLAAPLLGVVGAWSCLIVHLTVMALVMHLRFRGRFWEGRALNLDLDAPPAGIGEVPVSAATVAALGGDGGAPGAQ